MIETYVFQGYNMNSLQCKNVTCSNCCCASHHRFCYHGPRSTTYLLEQNFGAEQTVLGVEEEVRPFLDCVPDIAATSSECDPFLPAD